MRTPRTTPSTSCDRHSERPRAATCADCGTAMCKQCRIDIEHLGAFCWSCAARRGGLHPRPRAQAPPPPSEAPSEADAPPRRPSQSSLSVQLFESMVADREPRPLISGLRERLEEAGADPDDVVDDAELIDDIGRLQDLAATPPEQRAWRRHG